MLRRQHEPLRRRDDRRVLRLEAPLPLDASVLSLTGQPAVILDLRLHLALWLEERLRHLSRVQHSVHDVAILRARSMATTRGCRRNHLGDAILRDAERALQQGSCQLVDF